MIYFKEIKGFTPYKLVEYGLPLTTTQQLMNGTTTDPRISVIIKLAKIYNVSIDDLIFRNLSEV